jgi:hypothetical protein
VTGTILGGSSWISSKLLELSLRFPSFPIGISSLPKSRILTEFTHPVRGVTSLQPS